MANQVALEAQQREVLGKAVRRLRREGTLPANIYGQHTPSIAIQLDAHEFARMLATHGNTTIFRVAVAGGTEQTAMVGHVQREPKSGAMQHVDFIRVEMSAPVRVHVPLHFTGDAPGVKLYDGILTHQMEALEIEAVPGDLPEALDVDVSGLAELSAFLTAGDVRLPAGVTLLTSADERIVSLTPPRVTATEVEAASETATPTAEPTTQA